MGSLEVICGSMFSGKTEELMRRLRRVEYARQNALTIKHEIDNRSSYTCIVSHNGDEREAHPLTGCQDGLASLKALAHGDIDVVGIDEVQFFPMEVVDVVLELVGEGKRVVVSGLDLDFRGQPFGPMPLLLAHADSVTKLHAICVVCAQEASHTQRIIDGRPARYDEPTIMVGASECYEARCRNCFVIDKPASAAMTAVATVV